MPDWTLAQITTAKTRLWCWARRSAGSRRCCRAPTLCAIEGSKPKVPLGDLTVYNATPWAIAKVRFSLSTKMGWGEERLPGQAFLLAGEKRTWKVPAGSYHLQIQFQDGTSQETSAPHEVGPGKDTEFRIDPP